MLPRKYSEKRSFIRMELDCPLTYSDATGLRSREGKCLNLSAKGIALETNEDFPVGSTLKVNVTPKLALTPPFSATVKIVRSESSDDPQRFKLAGVIEEIA